MRNIYVLEFVASCIRDFFRYVQCVILTLYDGSLCSSLLYQRGRHPCLAWHLYLPCMTGRSVLACCIRGADILASLDICTWDILMGTATTVVAGIADPEPPPATLPVPDTTESALSFCMAGDWGRVDSMEPNICFQSSFCKENFILRSNSSGKMLAILKILSSDLQLFFEDSNLKLSHWNLIQICSWGHHGS